MDEDAAAAFAEDGAEGRPHGEDDAPQNYVKSTETADSFVVFCCRDCGKAFTEEAPYLEHCQQHPGTHSLMDTSSDDRTEAEGGVIDKITQCQTEETDGQNVSQEASTDKKTKGHTFECSHCGKSYGMIGHFLNHQRKHIKAPKSLSQDLEDLKKKSFQCEFCGRNYSRASALEAHLRCHEEKLVKPRNRDLEESLVAEETVIESQLSKTQTLDNVEKPFMCACGKAFAAQMGLKTHQRFSRNSQCSPEEVMEKTKKSVVEFSCGDCEKTFTSNIAFMNHQRWHHSKNSSKKIACEECGKLFRSLTFYHRHQRLAHSSETPSKSFLHQVCQLQKKAFECKECGLKFSRASALHSHELHHTDIFEETKVALPHHVLTNQQKGLERVPKTAEQEAAPPLNLYPVVAENVDRNETDDEECYGPGDFNVQVISPSESEDESTQHANPDLELLCESDREAHDDDALVSPGAGVPKQEMDLKIVQIDLNTANVEDAAVAKEATGKKTEERFECPECSLWFSSAASLRIHRMWHAVRKRRQQTQVQQAIHTCTECGLKFLCLERFNTHLHQHAVEEEDERVKEEEAQDEGDARLDLRMSENSDGEVDDGDEEKGAIDTDGGAGDGWEMSTREHVASLQAAVSMSEKLRNAYSCLACGKVYTYLAPFLKHQLEHKLHSTPRKSQKSGKLHRYKCSFCGMVFMRRVQLRAHMKNHAQKTLVRADLHQCDQCGKSFASTRTWAAHMELHKQHLFWCLGCSKGFPDEIALDKHLQGHNRKQHTCIICRKSFAKVTELAAHHKTHTAAKAYQCTMCAKSFKFLGNLILHRKQHLRAILGGDWRVAKHTSKVRFRKRKGQFSLSRKEKLGISNPEVPVAGNVESEGSDCGEPMHQLKPLSQPGESELETVALAAGQEVQEKQAGGARIHREHKYWEWDCCVCDMGFGEVEQLHLHYVKHATGELPILQEYV